MCTEFVSTTSSVISPDSPIDKYPRESCNFSCSKSNLTDNKSDFQIGFYAEQLGD